MTEPTFGITFTDENTGVLPVVPADMSIIGLVGTAPLADAGTFPSDTPVFLNSSDTTMLAKLGATGTLPQAINDINEQLGADEVAAQVVVVVVPVGVTVTQPAATAVINALAQLNLTSGGTGYTSAPTVAITGGGGTGATATAQISNGAVTGFTLTNAGSGFTSAPTVALSGGGGTGAAATATVATGLLSAINVTSANTGAYHVAPPVNIVGGGGTGATAQAVINGSGIVTSVQITSPGSGFTSVPTINFGGNLSVTQATIANLVGSVNALTGINALLDAQALCNRTPRLIAVPGYTSQLAGVGLANGVCAALPTVLARLRAVAVVDGPCTTDSDAANWRNTLNDERTIPLETAVQTLDANGDVITVPGSPSILGIAVKLDYRNAGIPSSSWANQAIAGIVGPGRPIGFSITDGASEGQELLAENLGIIVRGQSGSDAAIADGGFLYIGTDVSSTNGTYLFYHQRRIADYIALTTVRTFKNFLGRYNITRHVLQEIINTLRAELDQLKSADAILDYALNFTQAANPTASLQLGRLAIGFKAEPPPVLRFIGFTMDRYTQALDATIAEVIAGLSSSSTSTNSAVSI